jgi:aryl-phospho-beta-D-glucosidase BglC (GH1 family)
MGFWLNEDLINGNEHYPRNNAFEDFTNVYQWAASAGMYVLVDLHGLPGAERPMKLSQDV